MARLSRLFIPAGAATTTKTANGAVSTPVLTASGALDLIHKASSTATLSQIISSGTAVIAGGVIITDVNTTESWTDGDTGLIITGSGFV